MVFIKQPPFLNGKAAENQSLFLLCDAVLVSEFESMDDLNAYKVDPRHVAVSDICKSIRADRVAVDYEM